MKFTKIPVSTFEQLQKNAGILVDSFIPQTGTIGNILCATSGGLNFGDNPSFTDFGDDIDNCPKNTKQLKRLDDRDVNISGTGLTVTNGFIKNLMAAADIDTLDSSHVIPRKDLVDGDFHDLWWIGDYSDKNGNLNGGFLAIHLMDTLSTGGFQIQTGDKDKGKFGFTFTAHVDLEDQDTVPYEVYVKAGSDESAGYRMSVVSAEGSTTDYTAITTEQTAGTNESYVYQTGKGIKIPGEGSVLVGSAWTAWDGDDEIESESGLEIVVAIIDAESKSVHAGKAIVVVKE